MGYRELFGHVVEGKNPSVLDQISREEINLVLCNDPLSAETKAFFDRLPLDEIAAEEDYAYFNRIRHETFPTRELEQGLSALFSSLAAYEGHESIIADVMPLLSAFAKATEREGLKEMRGQLMAFHPSVRNVGAHEGAGNAGFWHEDGGHHIGITTLKGDQGSLWRPNHIKINGDDVDVENQDFIQKMDVGDFAIFKALKKKNPLTHATPVSPLTKQKRLVLLLDNNL